MRDRIVRLLFPMAVLLGRHSDQARHGGRHGAGHGNRLAGPRVSPGPRETGPWRCDITSGRVRRWQRRGLVPPAVEEWQPISVGVGVYAPPAVWEVPGTMTRPRVACEREVLAGVPR